jgi:hypothetical protein
MSATALWPEPLQLHAELSLGQLLTRAHEDVHAHGMADCPVCGGTLWTDGVDAHCGDCGSRLN